MASAEPGAPTCSLDDDDGMIQERPKLLEGIGLRALSLSHFVLENVKRLPFPLGSTIKVLEDIVGPPVRPLVTCLKNQSLHLLSRIDNQLYSIGHEVEKRAPGISEIVYKAQDLHVLSWKVANRLRTQGVVRAVSDMLAKYEALVKSRSNEAVNLVNKVLLLRILVPVLCTIGCLPLALSGSNWVVRRSEVRDKNLLVCEEESASEVYELDAADLEEKSMIGDEIAKKKESSIEAQKHDVKQARNENPVVETPQLPQESFPEDSSPDEIMEDGSPGKECDNPVKDIHDTQSAGRMPTEFFSKSLLDEDSDESDEVINLFLSGWSFNPVIGVKK